MFVDFMQLGYDTSMLALESQSVIALRLAKLAGGGDDAQREAQQMVTEKIFAAGETAILLASGGSTATAVAQYRRKVRANQRRLSRPRAASL